jgi:hypothetical protein
VHSLKALRTEQPVKAINHGQGFESVYKIDSSVLCSLRHELGCYRNRRKGLYFRCEAKSVQQFHSSAIVAQQAESIALALYCRERVVCRCDFKAKMRIVSEESRNDGGGWCDFGVVGNLWRTPACLHGHVSLLSNKSSHYSITIMLYDFAMRKQSVGLEDEFYLYTLCTSLSLSSDSAAPSH